jgi:hypothetical protein
MLGRFLLHWRASDDKRLDRAESVLESPNGFTVQVLESGVLKGCSAEDVGVKR